ncbi:MAG: lysophospholipid acyltransferase family protein [Pelosinus sp.]|nr:lysophospholipid acyltransferase family protein [Pelosinus sp.]
MTNEWQYNLLKVISKIVSKLPYRVILSLGKTLGRLYYCIAARQRRRALLQIEQGMNLSAAAAEDIIKKLFMNIGQTLLEVLYTPAMIAGNFEKYITIENKHFLTEAVAQNHGVVILTGHIGNWEWLGAALSLAGFPITTVIKRQPNEQYTRILNEYRELAGIEIFARGTTELVGAARALKKGKALGFLADQDGGEHGIWVDFFGKKASTPQGPAVFARRFHAPVIPAFIERCPQGGHRLVLHSPLYYEDTGNEEQDLQALTVRMTEITEAAIRRHPEEWLWFQKRWNTVFPGKAMRGKKACTVTKAGESI